MDRILIIQTAFIGDVILATPIIEKIAEYYPTSKIDFLLRKGNEILLKNNPHLNNIIVWDKRNNKNRNLLKLLQIIRKNKYDLVINVQRFLSTGILTGFSNAAFKVGFDNNPLSFLFTKKIKHAFKENTHEIDRNLKLVENFTDNSRMLPKLYPEEEELNKARSYKDNEFITISPTSVWFTKQFPKEKWIDFLNEIQSDLKIYLLGAPSDSDACNAIIHESTNKNITNLAGQLNLLESAALMKDAKMNYVNDSAPLHLASSMNAPCASVFCSTVPRFGFGPLSHISTIIETKNDLKCRPCGIHGFKTCPEKTFECAYSIETSQLNDLIK